MYIFPPKQLRYISNADLHRTIQLRPLNYTENRKFLESLNYRNTKIFILIALISSCGFYEQKAQTPGPVGTDCTPEEVRGPCHRDCVELNFKNCYALNFLCRCP